MRGAARIGGRAFRPTPSTTPRNEFNPLEALDLVGDLPGAPVLEPINDEWSWSLGAEPADPRDCTRYPASPYCGEIPFELGKPFGVTPELKTNGCETCLYVYPVILWLKATPQVICYRDPNCDRIKANRPQQPQRPPKAPYIPDGYYLAVNLVRAYSGNERIKTSEASPEIEAEYEANGFLNIRQRQLVFTLSNITEQWVSLEGIKYLMQSAGFFVANQEEYESAISGYLARTTGSKNLGGGGSAAFPIVDSFWIDWLWGISFDLIEKKTGRRTSPPRTTPPPPVPPFNDRIPINRKKGNGTGKGGYMCCNDCADSKDNTEKLLREIKQIKKALGTGILDKALNSAVGIGDGSVTTIVNLIAKRLGTSAYPIEVPQSLLQGVGDKVQKIDSNAEFLHWLTYQIDGLVGQFPINIEVKDIDPLKEGDQKKTIQLPNISEAIAEMYGLTIKNSVNQEVELNMLLRLAAETIATKNAAIVAQDYSRANATFLGYKANYKPRELQYNFDFTGASLDPRSKEPIVLEKLLKTVTGYVQGWEIADKETVVGFLQKLMFSAGIIKAVFFRGKGQQKELNREISAMTADESAQEAKFEAFIKEINDPNSRFNRNAQDKPEIKDETPPQ